MIQGFIGRVPVYDRALNLFAYELRPCSLPSGDESQKEKFLQQIWETLRLERLTGGRIGLISLPGHLLKGMPNLPWPHEKLIINLSREITSQLTREELQQLAAQGYLLAISGNRNHDPGQIRNLEFADILALEADAEIQPHQVKEAHSHGLKLLARHIETRTQYDTTFEEGFDYFQGRYFECPRLVHGTQIPANRLAVLHLIAHLQNPGVAIQEVENLISQDITLAYKLLRLINSAFYGLPKKVDSIRRAVVFLGLTRIKHWAIVILVNAIDYKPRELLITALVRAFTCEQIARKLERSDAEQCYISGLFSLLDAIMDAPMEEILNQVNLIDEINEALLYGTGPIGPILRTALSLEHGLCHQVPLQDLDLETAMEIYLDAIDQAEAIRQQLQPI